jgi:hypothetical protein
VLPLRERRDFPGTPRDLETAWLAIVLREAGIAGDLVSASVEPTPAGYGAVGSYARLRLAWSQAGPGAPRSIFAKFSSDKPAVRAHAHARGLYTRDARFYREVAPLVRLRTPRCWFAAVDGETGRSLLLLEDVAGGRGGDVLAGCSTADAELILRTMAAFHARWWGDAALSRWKWLPGYDTEPDPATDDYLGAWPVFRKRYLRLLSRRAVAAAEAALARMPRIRRELDARPQTFTHGDLSLDNVRFDLADAPMVLFDWQISMRAPASRDLSWFLARSLPVEQRRAEEDRLVEAYHAALVEAGVGSYPLEGLRRDIDLGVLVALVLVISAGVHIDFSSERGRRVIEARVLRNITMLEDHDADRLLS